MDDVTLAGLKTALSATPDNVALRMVLVRAYLTRQEGPQAHALVKDLQAAQLTSDADREVAARAALLGKDAELALVFAPSTTADGLLTRARALLVLDRRPEGLDAYRAALRLSSAVEDRDLEVALSSNVRAIRVGGDGPRLKVIDRGDEESDVQRVLVPETAPVCFVDVGGLANVKEQIRKRIILPFQKPSLFERFKKRVGGGILMFGPPGVGKTLIARATAGECNARFFNVAISDVLDMYVGESEQKLHALFEKARQSAPAVLFFDEVEALGGKRQYAREAATAKLVSQFLAEMDGFSQNNNGVLILGATNVPWAVDPAFRRPGRFDRFFFVPPPDQAAREEILRIHLKDRPTAGQLDLGWLARNTVSFSGADLRQLVEAASDEAIDASLEAGVDVPITDAHLKTALRNVKPTTLEWLTTARNHARYANEGGQYDEVLAFLDRHGKG